MRKEKEKEIKKDILKWNWFFWELLRRSKHWNDFQEFCKENETTKFRLKRRKTKPIISYDKKDITYTYNQLWNKCLERFKVTFHGEFSQRKKFPPPDFKFSEKDLHPPIVFIPFYPEIVGKPIIGKESVIRITDKHINYIKNLKEQQYVRGIRVDLKSGGFCWTKLDRPLPGYELFAVNWSARLEAIAEEIKEQIEKIQEIFYRPLIIQRQHFKKWCMYLDYFDEVNYKIEQGNSEKKAKKDAYDSSDIDVYQDTAYRGYERIKKFVKDVGYGKLPFLKLGI